MTFTVCALAAASAVYWGLKAWGAPAPAAIPALAVASAQPVDAKALARALGGGLAPAQESAQEAPAAASRYALLGVVAGSSEGGAALISVDGQEATPVRVGAAVEGGLVLESVTGRQAVLSSGGDDGAKMTLELPSLDN